MVAPVNDQLHDKVMFEPSVLFLPARYVMFEIIIY